MARVVGIDDEGVVRTLLEAVVQEQGHVSAMAGALAEGVAVCDRVQPDVIFLDMLLPDGHGLDAIKRLKKLSCSPEVIVITGHGSPEGAETAIRHGAAAYLAKPLSQETISLSLSRALAFRAQRQEAQKRQGFARPGIIGASEALQAALELAAQAAASQVSVLITGETGTGKECFAHAIHENSARGRKPFVIVDCAALSENLVGSQLFGHVRGAFTGADRERQGLVAQANGGTLFLDEVGEMPLAVQRAFLRVLEERRFRPLGASREESSDFRLIAATNRDLDEMVGLGLFRADLLYRMRGLNLHLPPLRERDGDLERLAAYFLDTHCLRSGLCGKNASSDFLETLRGYPWPGNVRELSHAMDRALTAVGSEHTIFANHLPLGVRVYAARQDMERLNRGAPDKTRQNGPTNDDGFPSLKEFRRRTEARYLEDLLARHPDDIREAARAAGLSRGHLYELLKKHGVERS